MPQMDLFGRFAGQVRLIALITPFATQGRDATIEDEVTYTRELRPMVVELDSVMALIGRFQTRGKWVIMDLSQGAVAPEFVPCDEDDVDVL